MKKQVPNIITLCNLLCGILSTLFAIKGRLDIAAALILLGIVFDFFDGFAARLLQVSSSIGKELDSLADLVTSGVAPGFILWYLLTDFGWGCWAYIALIIPLFAAFRLAKFNVDTRQTYAFLGLPVPANAVVWASVGACYANPSLLRFALLSMEHVPQTVYSQPGLVILVIVAIVGSLLMVSEVPMFALKFKNFSWQDNKMRFLFLGVDVIFLVLMGIWALPVIIVWYIILSFIISVK
ncbi:MAG: CDP-diacylglycerol--serine O-phosphatidyltransferase [Bacteroidales bacterium]|nr:CDP-diacylglycerol--serine O-phosphatidyltransferase [Candidatus Colimorpha onthohippi]